MKIVVFTKYYGRNFTGATLATCYFIQNWIKKENVEIIVVTKKTGDVDENDNIKVYRYTNYIEMYRILKKLGKENCIYYSDDHLGWLLSLFGCKYIHTYHGNWPQARYLNFRYFIKSFYFIPMYKLTLKHAQEVVNVSYFMEKFTRKYNTNTEVIRNGVDYKEKKKNFENKTKKCVMIGNVDKRKYKYALEVINKCYNMDNMINFEIYGKIIDKSIGQKLKTAPNCSIKGYCKNINFDLYDLLVCTSEMENLPISICEALKSNVAVISFKVGGITELICKKNGILIDNYDTEKMTERIIKYCNSSEFLNTEPSSLDEFNWELSAEKYFRLFEVFI